MNSGNQGEAVGFAAGADELVGVTESERVDRKSGIPQRTGTAGGMLPDLRSVSSMPSRKRVDPGPETAVAA